MKLCVYGLWHLGCVTAACCAAAGIQTIGLDADAAVVANLNKAVPPLHEPGLPGLVQEGLSSGKLTFSDNLTVVAEADIVWVTFDTPVDDQDRADVDAVLNAVRKIFPLLKNNAVVLISSQLPVGSTRRLAEDFAAVADGRRVDFAYSPENLRLGKAIQVFTQPERIVVGTDRAEVKEKLLPLLQPFCEQIIWISVPAAEMTKHGINAFLATSVTFINELAALCELVGADAAEVERALRSEPRIGQKAYIRPGAAFAGGTLARDVQFLQTIASEHHLSIPLLGSIAQSNRAHIQWPLRRLLRLFDNNLQGKTIALLGLTYKPGTNTLRRSQAVEVAQAILAKGGHVVAFDPAIQTRPADLPAAIKLAETMESALDGADAALLATEWPEFKALSPEMVMRRMRHANLIDANGMVANSFGQDRRMNYFTVGRAA